jgi:MFS family permease
VSTLVAPAPVPTDESWRVRALVPVLLFVGSVVALVSSLGAPLVPSVAIEYGVTVDSAQWTLTITLLTGAVTAPLIGRLGDGRHRRPVVITALSMALLGCVLGGLHSTFAVLLAGRVMLGFGFGLIPLTMSIARDHLPRPRARSTIATLSVIGAAGIGFGYPATGFIADTFGLHATFWAGSVMALGALLAAVAVIPPSSHHAGKPIDVLGTVLLATGLLGLLLAISEGRDWGWTSPRLLLICAGSFALLGLWTRHELRTEFPLVELRLMNSGPVLTANVTAAVAGVGMYMLISLVTRFVQTPTSTGYGLGESVFVAGLVLVPFSVASLVTAILNPWIIQHLRQDFMLPIGSLVFILSFGVFRFAHSELWELYVVLALVGVGVGFTFAGVPALIMRAVPAEETGSALAMNQVVRTVGYSIGSALSAAILASHTAAPSLYPTNSGYNQAIIVAAVMCACAVVVSIVLPGRGGHSQPKRDPISARQVTALAEESVAGAASGLSLLDPQGTDKENA